MSLLPRIACLWIEGPLSYLEQLCIKSFLDHGHEVTLYTYGEVTGAPEGVVFADAAPILDRDNMFTHSRTGSPALHSDKFRYKLLERDPGVIWADTDAFCVRPFEPVDGHFYGWESETTVNGGVLALPADSETLRELLAFVENEYPIPEWFAEEEKDELRAARDRGEPVHVGKLKWGVWGPLALTHFLRKTGEIRYALPTEALYPVPFRDRRHLLKRGRMVEETITSNTYSVHFYGRRIRRRLIEAEAGGVPKFHCYMGRMLRQHGVDPAKAPIQVPRSEEERMAEDVE